jgi:RNA polymerase sigma-70 factor (ECF subfamily)
MESRSLPGSFSWQPKLPRFIAGRKKKLAGNAPTSLLVGESAFSEANRHTKRSSNQMMEESDAVAVCRAQAGDQEAFRVLVERHSVRLFQVAYRMTGNEQDAEDVVQDSFLRAYKQLDRFESRAGFATWLHRIAVNCSLDLLRKRKRRDERTDAADLDTLERESTPASPAPDHQVFHFEVRQKVEAAMEQLTPMERTAFVLRHFEGRSIGEIGRVLGAGQSATKQSIFRAVQKLRRALEPVLNPTP